MAYWTKYNKHAGGKNGGSSYYGPRREAKKASNVGRRREDKKAIRGA